MIPGTIPDIVLMDIHLSGISGIECVRKLKPSLGFTQFTMCTVYEDNENVFGSLCAGATGYLLKNSPPTKITDAITELFHGGSPMSSVIARKVIQTFKPSQEQSREIEKLTGRERELLDLLAKGYRYKEIADRLTISFETVRTHIHNIYEKLHVQSRTEALNKIYPR
ncbi:MAG: response regulator transcription factor [Bacteroidetes bacterium]|nr:response regulator transcription factor [Bacteroidota bacterium]